MTIKEFAENIGVTRATVYNRCKAAGIDLDGLRDADGNLTEDGLKMVAAVLDGVKRRQQPKQLHEQDEAENEVGQASGMAARLAAAEARVEAQERVIEQMEREIKRLEAALDDQRKERDAWHTAYTDQRQALLTATATGAGRGWGALRDLFGRKRKSNAE